MTNITFSLTQIALAATNITAMVTFYNTLFDTHLVPIQARGTTLYRGMLSGVPFVICPNTLANVQAEQNRHQFSYTVADLHAAIQQAYKAGGRLHSELQANEPTTSATILDPDGNTIVFIQAV